MEKSLDQAEPSSLSGKMNRARARGRPTGSKNKDKAPTVVTKDTSKALESHLLEISSGADIMQSLANYACQRGKGISVLSGNGVVINATLRNSIESNGVVTLTGRFEMLSLTGTILPPPAPPGAGRLSIFLSGGDGRVVGGSVVGPLVADGPVLLMVALFSNAVYERLPFDQEQLQLQEVHQEMHGTGAGGGYPFPGGDGLSEWDGNAPRPPF
ncbi:AT-hook motif nuclear-localized protein 27-like [Silene latifolia]|uniref:AT-hook motif nuclear-localized protein 27-like n=1 Tax=Silene latifolia TaxID=37657 RepID=UPI003D76A8EC